MFNGVEADSVTYLVSTPIKQSTYRVSIVRLTLGVGRFSFCGSLFVAAYPQVAVSGLWSGGGGGRG